MSCKVTIEYKPSIEFGRDKVLINIEDTTYGALQVLAHQLKKMVRPIKDTDSYTQLVYLDMLKQISIELDKKLNEEL